MKKNIVGVGCTTVLNSTEAALAAAKILSLNDYIIYGRVLFSQLNNIEKILVSLFKFSIKAIKQKNL